MLFWSLHRQMHDGLSNTSSPRYYGGWILMALLATWMAAWLLAHDEFLWAMAWGALGFVVAWVRYKLHEAAHPEAQAISSAALLWALIFWFVPALGYIHDHVGAAYHVAVSLGFAAASVALFEISGSLLNWAAMRKAQVVLPLAMLFAAGGQLVLASHPFAAYGGLAWIAAFAVFYVVTERQSRSQIVVAGGVQRLLAVALLIGLLTWEAGWLLVHHRYEMSALLAIAAIAGAYLRFDLRERNDPDAMGLSVLVLLWGLAVWLVSGNGYIDQHVLPDLRIACGLGFVVASCVLFESAGSALTWSSLRRTQALLLPAMAIALALQIEQHAHPAAGQAWLAWLTALAAFYSILYRQQKADIALGASNQHVLAVWFAAGLIAWELAWQFELSIPGTSWPFAIGGWSRR